MKQNNTRRKMLVAEDDERLQEILTDFFSAKGWKVITVSDGYQALAKVDEEAFDIVLLDVMMEGMDGFRTCQKIRASYAVPIIFLTARVSEEDKLNGYSLGADDYVTKPFSLPVLSAKIDALLNRFFNSVNEKLKYGNIEMDPSDQTILIDGNVCRLAKKEYEILKFFLENPEHVFSREQLLIRFWGYDFEGNERVVDNHIRKLRKALGKEGNMIHTIHKSGYLLSMEKTK